MKKYLYVYLTWLTLYTCQPGLLFAWYKDHTVIRGNAVKHVEYNSGISNTCIITTGKVRPSFIVRSIKRVCEWEAILHKTNCFKHGTAFLQPD